MIQKQCSSGYSKIGVALLVLSLSLVGLGIAKFYGYIKTRQAEIRAEQIAQEQIRNRQTGRIATSSYATTRNTNTTRPPGDNTQYPKEFITPSSSAVARNSEEEIQSIPSIRITSPNGGEQLHIGDIFTITWETKNVSEDAWVRIGYILPASVTGKQSGVWLECIEDVPAYSGEYDWDVPTSFNGCGDSEELVPEDIKFASQIAIELFASEPKCEGDISTDSSCGQGSTRVIASDVSDSYFTITNRE